MSNATETAARSRFAHLLTPGQRAVPVMEIDGPLAAGTAVAYAGSRQDLHGEYTVAGGCLCFPCFMRMGDGEQQPLVLRGAGGLTVKHVRQAALAVKEN